MAMSYASTFLRSCASEVFPAHVVVRVLAVLRLGLEDGRCGVKGVDRWYASGRIIVALVNACGIGVNNKLFAIVLVQLPTLMRKKSG